MVAEILNMKVKRAKHTDCKSARASFISVNEQLT